MKKYLFIYLIACSTIKSKSNFLTRLQNEKTALNIIPPGKYTPKIIQDISNNLKAIYRTINNKSTSNSYQTKLSPTAPVGSGKHLYSKPSSREPINRTDTSTLSSKSSEKTTPITQPKSTSQASLSPERLSQHKEYIKKLNLSQPSSFESQASNSQPAKTTKPIAQENQIFKKEDTYRETEGGNLKAKNFITPPGHTLKLQASGEYKVIKNPATLPRTNPSGTQNKSKTPPPRPSQPAAA